MPSFATLSAAEVLEVVLYERSVHGQATDAELEPYLIWIEEGTLPTWEAGVTSQEISGGFQAFVRSNDAAQHAVEELEALANG